MACARAGSCAWRMRAPTLPAPSDVLWIDLLDPTHEEEKAVEALLGLQVPTRQEMAEIEESARLYQEHGALVMTAVVINGVAEGRPSRTQVTFVLTPIPSGLGALRRPGALPHVRGQEPAPAGGPHHQRQPPGLAAGEHRRARRRRAGDGGGRPERGLDPARSSRTAARSAARSSGSRTSSRC